MIRITKNLFKLQLSHFDTTTVARSVIFTGMSHIFLMYQATVQKQMAACSVFDFYINKRRQITVISELEYSAFAICSLFLLENLQLQSSISRPLDQLISQLR
jgi:hypothetical protein